MKQDEQLYIFIAGKGEIDGVEEVWSDERLLYVSPRKAERDLFRALDFLTGGACIVAALYILWLIADAVIWALHNQGGK
jgi:hypothetical protein